MRRCPSVVPGLSTGPYGHTTARADENADQNSQSTVALRSANASRAPSVFSLSIAPFVCLCLYRPCAMRFASGLAAFALLSSFGQVLGRAPGESTALATRDLDVSDPTSPEIGGGDGARAGRGDRRLTNRLR